MAQLASRTGLAKGTLYLYFATKEEVFLAVLDELLEHWLGELTGRFANLRRPVTPRALAGTILRSLQTRRELIRLLPLVETLLDRGASDQAVLSFERRTLAQLRTVGQALEKCFPALKAGSGIRLLLLMRALIMGIYLRANKPARIRRVVAEHAELKELQVRFDQEFSLGAEALIEGYLKLRGQRTNLRSSG